MTMQKRTFGNSVMQQERVFRANVSLKTYLNKVKSHGVSVPRCLQRKTAVIVNFWVQNNVR